MTRFSKCGRGLTFTTSALLTAWMCMGSATNADIINWDGDLFGDEDKQFLWSEKDNWAGNKLPGADDTVQLLYFAEGDEAKNTVYLDTSSTITELNFTNGTDTGTKAPILYLNEGKTLTVKKIAQTIREEEGATDPKKYISKPVTALGDEQVIKGYTKSDDPEEFKKGTLKASEEGLTIGEFSNIRYEKGKLNMNNKTLTLENGSKFTLDDATVSKINELQIKDSSELVVKTGKLSLYSNSTLNLGTNPNATSTINANDDGEIAIAGKIIGSSELHLKSDDNTGSFTISNSTNRIATDGGIVLESGTLNIGHDNAIDDDANAETDSKATLTIEGGTIKTASNKSKAAKVNGIVEIQGNFTAASNYDKDTNDGKNDPVGIVLNHSVIIANNATVTVKLDEAVKADAAENDFSDANAVLEIAGVISGDTTHTFAKDGEGTLIISNKANTFEGNFELKEGKLRLVTSKTDEEKEAEEKGTLKDYDGKSTALGSGTFTVSGDSTLEVDGQTLIENSIALNDNLNIGFYENTQKVTEDGEEKDKDVSEENDSLTLAGDITNGANAKFTIDEKASVAHTGRIVSGNFTKSGEGTLVLNGDSTYKAADDDGPEKAAYADHLVIEQGTVVLENNTALGDGQIDIKGIVTKDEDDNDLKFDNGDLMREETTLLFAGKNFTLNNNINLSSDLEIGKVETEENTEKDKDAEATITLTKNVALQDFTVTTKNDDGSETTVTKGGNYTLNINDQCNVVLADGTKITGKGQLDKDGNGALIINGDITTDGGLRISDGKVLFKKEQTIKQTTIKSRGTLNTEADLVLTDVEGEATSHLNILNGKKITFNNTKDSTFAGIIGQTDTTKKNTSSTDSTPASVVKTGTHTLTLSGSNTYSGGTTIKEGAILANSDTAFGTKDVTIETGAGFGVGDENVKISNNIILGEGNINFSNNGGSFNLTGNLNADTSDSGSTIHFSNSTDVLTISGTTSGGKLTFDNNGTVRFATNKENLGDKGFNFTNNTDVILDSEGITKTDLLSKNSTCDAIFYITKKTGLLDQTVEDSKELVAYAFDTKSGLATSIDSKFNTINNDLKFASGNSIAKFAGNGTLTLTGKFDLNNANSTLQTKGNTKVVLSGELTNTQKNTGTKKNPIWVNNTITKTGSGTVNIVTRDLVDKDIVDDEGNIIKKKGSAQEYFFDLDITEGTAIISGKSGIKGNANVGSNSTLLIKTKRNFVNEKNDDGTDKICRTITLQQDSTIGAVNTVFGIEAKVSLAGDATVGSDGQLVFEKEFALNDHTLTIGKGATANFYGGLSNTTKSKAFDIALADTGAIFFTDCAISQTLDINQSSSGDNTTYGYIYLDNEDTKNSTTNDPKYHKTSQINIKTGDVILGGKGKFNNDVVVSKDAAIYAEKSNTLVFLQKDDASQSKLILMDGAGIGAVNENASFGQGVSISMEKNASVKGDKELTLEGKLQFENKDGVLTAENGSSIKFSDKITGGTDVNSFKFDALENSTITFNTILDKNINLTSSNTEGSKGQFVISKEDAFCEGADVNVDATRLYFSTDLVQPNLNDSNTSNNHIATITLDNEAQIGSTGENHAVYAYIKLADDASTADSNHTLTLNKNLELDGHTFTVKGSNLIIDNKITDEKANTESDKSADMKIAVEKDRYITFTENSIIEKSITLSGEGNINVFSSSKPAEDDMNFQKTVHIEDSNLKGNGRYFNLVIEDGSTHEINSNAAENNIYSTVVVKNDYTLSKNTTLRIDANNDSPKSDDNITQCDLIKASNNINIDSDSKIDITLHSDGIIKNDQEFKIMTTSGDGVINDSANGQNLNDNMLFINFYKSNSSTSQQYVVIAHAAYNYVHYANNADKSAARPWQEMVDCIANSDDPDAKLPDVAVVANHLNGSLVRRDPKTKAIVEVYGQPIGNKLSQLNVGQHAAPTAQNLAASSANYNQVSGRLSALRGGANLFAQNGADHTHYYDYATDPDLLALAIDDPRDVLNWFNEKEVSVWSKIFGQYATQDETDEDLAYTALTAGLVLGVDKRINENFILGAMASYTGSEIEYDDNRGEAAVNTLRSGVYSTYYVDNKWYVDSSATIGFSWNDVDRQVNLEKWDWQNGVATYVDTLKRTANANYESYDASLYIGSGYDFKLGNFTVTPNAWAQYTYYWQEAFEEDGADSLNTNVEDYSNSTLRTQLGAKVSSFMEYNGRPFIPEFSIGWAKTWGDLGEIQATFQGNSTPFEFTPGSNNDQAFLVGGGVTTLLTERISLYVKYDGELSENNQVHSISSGMKFKF